MQDFDCFKFFLLLEIGTKKVKTGYCKGFLRLHAKAHTNVRTAPPVAQSPCLLLITHQAIMSGKIYKEKIKK